MYKRVIYCFRKKNGVNFYNSESKIWINFVIFYVFGIGIVYRIYIRYNSI